MLRVPVAGLPGGPGRHLAVGRAEVDQVEAVAHERAHPGLGRARRGRPRSPPSLWLIGRQVRGLCVNTWRLSQPRSRPRPMALLMPAGGRDVGAESHADYPTGVATRPTRGDRPGARALRPEPDRQPARGRRRARRSSTGSWPGTPAAPSSCASRTPTASAPRPRARPRSCARSPGSGSTGTRGPSARASAATSTPTRSSACGPPAPSTRPTRPTRSSRPSAPPPGPTSAPRWCAAGATATPDEIAELEAAGPRARRGASPSSCPAQTVIEDYVRGPVTFDHGADRGLRRGALGRHAHLQPRGRGGRPGRWASATSSAARTTSPTRPSR